MTFQVGNREKIAGLLILCLVAIGAVHWFVFMSKAHAYRQAFEDYQGQRGRWTTMVSPQQKPQIDKMILETQTYEDYVDELVRDLNVHWEPLFFDQSKKGVTERQKRLVELIEQICDLRAKHPKIRLTFMDWRNYQGWDIPSQLPSGIPLWDLVEKLRNIALTLSVLKNPVEQQAARAEYNKYLRGLGVNPDFLDPYNPYSIGYRYGELVPLIKRIAHARLIWAQKEKDEKSPTARIPITALDDLYGLLDIKLPEDPEVLFHAIKQLQFFLKLVKMAEETGVDEITSATLLPVRKIDMAGDENNKPRLLPEQHFDHFFQDTVGGWQATRPNWPAAPGVRPGWGPAPSPPRMEEVSVDGRWTPPGGSGPGGTAPTGTGMTQLGGFEPASVPTPQPLTGGDWIGNSVPIRFGYVASWETALNFVWVISHNRNPFEVDSWELRSVPGGKIQAEVTVAPMAWVKMIDALYAPPSTATVTAAVAPPPARVGGPAAAAAPPPRVGAPPSRLGIRRPPTAGVEE